MSKKTQKIFVIGAAALVVVAALFFQSSDTLFGAFLEQYTEPNWDEVTERNIVKNSIPVTILEEQGSKCNVTEQKFDDIIIKHLSNMPISEQPSIPSSPQPAPVEGAKDNAWKAVSNHHVLTFDRDGIKIL